MSRFCSTDVKIKNLFIVDSRILRDTEGEEKKRNCRIPCEIAEIETTSWRTSGATFNASETEKNQIKGLKQTIFRMFNLYVLSRLSIDSHASIDVLVYYTWVCVPIYCLLSLSLSPYVYIWWMFGSYYYIYRTAFDFSKINVFTLNSVLFHVITFLVAQSTLLLELLLYSMSCVHFFLILSLYSLWNFLCLLETIFFI